MEWWKNNLCVQRKIKLVLCLKISLILNFLVDINKNMLNGWNFIFNFFNIKIDKLNEKIYVVFKVKLN